MRVEKDLKEIRKKIFLVAISASIAHIASAFSIVEILYVLYVKKILKYNLKNINNRDRDIFILSKGHGSLALYVILNYVGFFDNKILEKFSKPGSILGGEPCIPLIPGIEATTGSLGHGLSIAIGMAIANKMDKKSGKIYVLLGDGECEEGIIWEAAMFSNHYKLSNLIIIIDCNNLQKMGTIKDIMSIQSWSEKFASFGFIVEEVDGHNVSELEKVLKKDNKTIHPKVILAKTVKGKGVSIIESDSRWHWRLPNKKETKIFMEELGVTQEEVEKCKKHM